MAATAWAVHHEVLDLLSDKILEFNTDTFNLILGDDGSNMCDLSLQYYSAVTGEVSTNYGYTQAGEALADPAWTEAAGTAKWDEAGADTVWTASGGSIVTVWTASGGSIVARKACIYNDTSSNDVLICSSSLSSSDITATDGNTFTLAMNASGIFTVS